MAFRIARPSGATYYSVDYSVGTAGPNFRDDVYLVQALLNAAYFDNPTNMLRPLNDPWGAVFPSGITSDLEPLALDGRCGKKTIHLIRVFQRAFLNGLGAVQGFDGSKYNPDGFLGPIRISGNKLLAGKHLTALNHVVMNMDLVHGGKRHLNIRYIPALIKALSCQKSTSNYHLGKPP